MPSSNVDLLWAVIIGTSAVLLLATVLVIALIIGHRQYRAAQQEKMNALQESEQRFRNLVENVNAYYYVSDARGKLQYGSPNLFRATGYTAQELLGRSYLRLVASEDRRRVVEHYLARTRDGSVDTAIEFRARRKDGTSIWVEQSTRIVRDIHGKVMYYHSVVRDVSDRKRVEEALRFAEAKYRSLVESIPAITYIALADKIGGTVYVSPQIHHITGYTRTEWEQQPSLWSEHLFEEDRDRVLAEYLHAGKHNLPFRSEYRFIRKDGRIVWFRDEASIITDERGNRYFHGAVFDITETKALEASLRQNFRQLEAIYQLNEALNRAESESAIFREAINAITVALHADHASVLLLDEHGVMRFRAWHRLSAGYRQRVEGHSPWSRNDTSFDIIPIPDIFQEASLQPFLDAMAEEGIRSLVFVPLVLKGKLIGKFMVYFDSPHESSQSELHLCHAIAYHICFALERLHAQEALRQLTSRVIEAQETERKRISRELHDSIGQMLSSVKFRLHAAIERGAKQTEIAHTLHEVQMLLEKTLQEVRRISQNLRPSVLDDLGLAAAVRSLTEEFEKQTHIPVLLKLDELPERLPSEIELVLFRIIQEAMTNVQRHAQATQLVVTVDHRDGTLRVSIRDNGRGFDPPAMETKPGVERGLGLDSIEERAASIGGSVRIESLPGKGTDIIVQIPLGTLELQSSPSHHDTF